MLSSQIAPVPQASSSNRHLGASSKVVKHPWEPTILVRAEAHMQVDPCVQVGGILILIFEQVILIVPFHGGFYIYILCRNLT